MSVAPVNVHAHPSGALQPSALSLDVAVDNVRAQRALSSGIKPRGWATTPAADNGVKPSHEMTPEDLANTLGLRHSSIHHATPVEPVHVTRGRSYKDLAEFPGRTSNSPTGSSHSPQASPSSPTRAWSSCAPSSGYDLIQQAVLGRRGAREHKGGTDPAADVGATGTRHEQCCVLL